MFALIEQTFLTTRRTRIIAVATAILIAFGLLAINPMIIGGIFIFGASFTLLKRVWYLAQCVKTPSLRKLCRGMRFFRGVLSYTPTVELLYLAPMALMMIPFIWFFFTARLEPMNFFTPVAIAALSMASAIDNFRQIQFLAKRVWAKALGKLLFALISALVIILAAATAKQLVHLATHVDPKYLSDVTNLFAFAISAFFYALAITCVLFGWAMAQALLLGVLFFTEQSAGVSRTTKVMWQRAAYRFRTGKKAPADYDPKFFESGVAVFVMRPIALLLLIGQFWSAVGDLTNQTVPVDRLVERAIVMLEYKSSVPCGGRVEANQATYLDDGHISVFDPNATGAKFSIRKCSGN